MKITVFTPTYNRAYILPRTYESIKKQHYSDFEWVIMDDGSVDNTMELVERWQKEGTVTIKYYKQNNHGRFSAFNNAKKYFEGDLIAFLDSDDYFLDGSIQKLADTWNQIQEPEKCSGIIAYMETKGGDIVGTGFPNGVIYETIYRLYDKYRMKGDKFLAFRNDLIQKYEYPIFENEKFGGDSILFNQINDEYPMYLLREKISFREYMEDSITNNLSKFHMNSQNGMREHYKDALRHERYSKIRILKHCIGFVAFSKLTNRTFIQIIEETPKKLLTFLMYPIGILYVRKLKRGL